MNTVPPSLAEALTHAELLHKRSELQAVIGTMGVRIDAALGSHDARLEPARTRACTYLWRPTLRLPLLHDPRCRASGDRRRPG